MTMYVRALASISINVGDDDEQRPEFRLDKNATKVLPLWVAQEPGFQRLWAANKVQVATDSGFTNIITTIPDSETLAGLTGAISASSLKTALAISNVDNTSDATKNIATATLSGKTLTAPALTGTSKVATGGTVELYNTADQTTNFEKLAVRYSSNVAEVGTLFGGTGTARSLRLGVGASAGTSVSRVGSMVQITALGGSAYTASSGTQTMLAIDPTMTQTGTAGYTMLLVNPTDTGTGSGTKLLADFQLGGSSKAKIDNTGLLTANATASTVTSITAAAGTTTLTAASSEFQLVTGAAVQTIVLPSAVSAGRKFTIYSNVNSASYVAVQASDATFLTNLSGLGWSATFTALQDTPTTNSHWGVSYPSQAYFRSTAVASSVALRDSNINLFSGNFIATRTSTATTAGTTTLTIASSGVQVFTGSTTQTVLLPTTSVIAGQSYTIINNSSGNVTVQSSGGGTIHTLTYPRIGIFMARFDTPTLAADWIICGASSSSGTSSNTMALRDTNGNLFSQNFIPTKTSTATAAGTTTLSNTTSQVQEFTGSTTQTVKLPTGGIAAGQSFTIINNSTGILTVQSSGANTISTVSSGTAVIYIALVDTPTTAAHWRAI